MTSRDDDTMPLPGFSQELSSDITVDEDFIPTSQPQSTISSKASRNSDSNSNKSEELTASQVAPTLRIDDTLPAEAVIDQSTIERDKSADFIPDTETKKTTISYANQELSCKKKLPIFGPGDGFEIQLNPRWDVDVSQIPESPALDTQNFSTLKESLAKVLPSNQETTNSNEESITEIIVNDSAETVDLEVTPVRIKKLESVGGVEKHEIYGSSNSDVERCEETQIFDNSSILLLDQPGTSRLGLENNECISGVTSKKYFQDIVDDNKENSPDRANGFGLQCSPAEFSKRSDNIKLKTTDVANVHHNEVLPQPVSTERTNATIETKKIDFKLTVSCQITFNATTNKILHKAILNVSETVKPKPKPIRVEHASDNTSDKSKRHSTSSSGSVYSDKMGLPFALPKRISAISDQTDSSEEDFSVQVKREKRRLERMPWSNEYLLPLKMDDIMQGVIDKEDFLKKPLMPSPKKPKTRHCNGVNQLKEILENSSSSRTSGCDVSSEEPEPTKTSNPEEISKTGTSETSETEIKNSDENVRESERDTNNVGGENVQSDDKQQSIDEPKPAPEPETDTDTFVAKQNIQETLPEKEMTSIELSDGLPVFARWTDKRYYSGVLSGSVKSDRWDVKFDDGTSKTVREDLIMPADWLTAGALVFALTDDKYESGQIIDVKRGKEVNYIVELDTEKKEVTVKISDLCLTDVMAGIVREKYKPLSGTPRGRADIDFDNVLSGKRLREQRTPLRPPLTVGAGSSGLKKKSSKSKKDEAHGLKSIKETPPNKGIEIKIGGLKSDNGHLVEDKIISTDSLSENETRETPLRGNSKEARGKGKPRSLSYEPEETRSGKNKRWLTSDGTPIPGPSGVKSKKQKTKAKIQESETTFVKEIEPVATISSKKSPAHSKVPQSNEKSKRKRKLDEYVDHENIQKKSLKEGSSKVKTRGRKG